MEWHQARPTEYTSEQIRTLHQAAGPLGLLRTAAPSEAAYDLTIVLGGTVTGNEVRAGFTFNLIDSAAHDMRGLRSPAWRCFGLPKAMRPTQPR